MAEARKRADGSEEERERFQQPHPGSTGHAEEEGESLEVEPEVDEAEGESSADEPTQADQESKHSYPTSDPPANY